MPMTLYYELLSMLIYRIIPLIICFVCMSRPIYGSNTNKDSTRITASHLALIDPHV